MAGMRTTIDAAGRVVIPKAIRDGAGLRPGSALDVTLVDGRIEIELAAPPVRLIREGHFLVATPVGGGDPLWIEEVERVRHEIQNGRASDLVGE